MSQSPAKIAYVFRVRMTTKDDIKIAYVPLEKFMIGSTSGLPIVIKEKTVEPQHLAVTIVDNQIFLTDQKTASGSRVNGRSLAAHVPFQYCPGDRISIGDSESFLQIHLFMQAHDIDLEPARVIQEAQVRARELSDEMIRRAQEEIKARSEEWTQASRERILAVAQADARALLEKAESDARAQLAEAHELAIKQKKLALLQADELLQDAREGIKVTGIEVERKLQTMEAMAEQKAARILREAREGAEAILKEAQAASLEFKSQAHEQGQKILSECKKHDEEKRKFIDERCEATLREARAEADNRRRELEDEISQILKSATEQALTTREQARIEAEKITTEAQELVRQQQEQARIEVQTLLAQARTTALEIERRAQEDAHRRSHEAFQSVVTDAESRALALIQERDVRSQKLHEQSVAEANLLLAQAHTEAARILQEGKLNCVVERREHVNRIMDEANEAAEKIRAQARTDAQEMIEAARSHDMHSRAKLEQEMAALYLECQRKGDLIVEGGRNEALMLLDAARAEAHTLKEQAHARAQEIVGNAKGLVTEIEDSARGLSTREAEEQRQRTADELFKMREQTQEAYRLAKVYEAETRAELEREMALKRTELEAELRQRRTAELNRIDMHWAAKRQADIKILMRNFELAWPKMNSSASQDAGLNLIRAVVEQSFGEKPEPAAPVNKTWYRSQWLKDHQEKAVMMVVAVVIVGAIGLIFADRADLPVVSQTSGATKRIPAQSSPSMIESLDIPSGQLPDAPHSAAAPEPVRPADTPAASF